MARLLITLIKGQMHVILPGASRTDGERTVPLARGQEAALLFRILKAQDAGERGIESRAEPTISLAFHTAHHTRTPVDTCAHCRHEAASRDGTKIKRYGKRGGLQTGRPKRPMTMQEILDAIASMPPAERAQAIKEIIG